MGVRNCIFNIKMNKKRIDTENLPILTLMLGLGGGRNWDSFFLEICNHKLALTLVCGLKNLK